jgi:anti-sigma regulatory factor (Ser/Thr protein kinase)
MPESIQEILSLDVPCDRAAPGVVRHRLSRVQALGSRVRSDVMLVASELVTNAVVHSGCLRDQMLKVRASLSRDEVTISVHEPGRPGPRASGRFSEDFEGSGAGLQIIDQLAARWGAERGDGYRVWAKLALTS